MITPFYEFAMLNIQFLFIYLIAKVYIAVSFSPSFGVLYYEDKIVMGNTSQVEFMLSQRVRLRYT